MYAGSISRHSAGIAIAVCVIHAALNPAYADDDVRATSIEEIIITSNRRAENVQDVAGDIRVLTGESLDKAATASFEDYVFRIPGADILDDGASKRIAIRGISNMAQFPNGSGSSTSPIGIYLNDTPIQGSGNLPDLDLYDLTRIEVLKGPQGTLYGEGAQGGAFKMLLNPAEPEELSAKGEIGIGHTSNGSGLNHFQKAAVNAPLLGSWAMRLVGTRHVDQGYVDFPNRGTRGEDDATNMMGRVHLDGELWSGLSASGLLFHQRQKLDQFASAQQREHDLRNENSEPQFARTNFTLGALTLEQDLGFASLTSSTSGFLNDREALIRTPLLAGIVFAFTNPVTGGPIPGLPPLVEQEWVGTRSDQLGIAQELRLVSSGDSWLQWITGFYFRRRENDFHYLTENSASDLPPPVGPGVFGSDGTETYEQYALFGEGTVALPWNFALTLGLRAFREDVGLTGTISLHGPFYPLAVASGEPDGEIPEKSFDITTTAVTPKVSVSWFADDSRMLYALVANGVRSGGTNPDAIAFGLPPLFEPDELWTYEVGAKTEWLEGALTANAAAFYNDWRDLQLLTTVPATIGPIELTSVAVANAARAVSKGVEAELRALPIDDLTLGFNLFVGRGEIVEGDAAGNIPDGTPIPQLAKLGYSAFANYEASRWPILGFTPSLAFDAQATGARTAFPPYGGVQSPLAGFHTYGVLLGFASEQWDASFGIRNLTDARPQLGANPSESDTLTIGRPRTWMIRTGFRW